MTIRRLLRATDSLSDLAPLAPFVEGDALITLQDAARSRLWLALHANSRRQLRVLLDIIDAGNQLGEGETSLWAAAEERVCELLLEDDEALLRHLRFAAA